MRSVNQNHHLYVITENGRVAANDANLDSEIGSIKAVVTNDTPNDLYFMYKGRDGVTRSDLIPIDQISYIKHVPAAKQATKLKEVSVYLDPDIHEDGKPIAGKDYILNIEFQQFYGLSPEDTYVKTVAVHATSKMDAQSFWTAMIDELNASFSREVGATADSNPYLMFVPGVVDLPDPNGENEDDTISVNALTITEKEQPWSLGKWEAESLMFNVNPSTIYIIDGDKDSEELVWGKTEVGVSKTAIPNSKKMADLEWFTFSERADFYRGMGYPNNFDFVGLVNPDYRNGYDALEIHFAYQGSCEDIQKSEKDITIIGPAAKISSLKSNVASLTDITIATVQ